MTEETGKSTAPVHAVVMPCPFCGQRVDLKFIEGDWGYTPNMVGIRCELCGIGFVERSEEWKQGVGTYSIRDQAKAKVLAKWNTRKA